MKIAKIALMCLLGLFLIGQFFRIDKTNPPVDPARTMRAQLHMTAGQYGVFDRSCRDCHSNETRWPWYSNVAPVSWLLGRDVKEGRRELNISDWARYDQRRAVRKLKAICGQVKQHEMPLWFYVAVHPQARLSDADRQALCGWAEAVQQSMASQAPNETARASTN